MHYFDKTKLISQGRRLNIYELIHEIPVRDAHGEISDWKATIIATGRTVKGLVSFARMKKLDPDTHYIEAEYIEYENGLPITDSEKVGHLNELL